MSLNITVTGTWEAITGTTTGYVTIQLVNFGSNIPVISGTGLIAQTSFTTSIGATFSQALYANDQISPDGTYYVFSYYNAVGSLVASVPYRFTGIATVDMSTATPYLTSGANAGFSATAVVTNPTAVQTVSNFGLTIAGTTTLASLILSGTLTDSLSAVGTSGQVLSSTGSAVKWVNPPATGVTSVATSGLATGGTITSTGTIAVAGSGSTTTAATAATNLATATSGHVLTADGLGNVQDSGTGLAVLATLASPALSGTPTAPTATGGTNTTQIATTAFVQSALGGVSSAFNALTTGTNTTATMTVGAGATLTYTSSGVINATELLGSTWSSPGAIGGTTAASGTFTTLTANTSLTINGGTAITGQSGTGGTVAMTAGPTFTGTLTCATLAATTINGAAFSGTFTGAPTFSGNIGFTGTPTFSNALALGSSTATTQSAGDNSTKIATTAYVSQNATPLQSVNAQTGTTYTGVLADANITVTMNNSSASTFKVDKHANVAYPVGTVLTVVQLGTGQVTVTALTGVTIYTPSSLTTRAQYSTVLVEQVSTDTWVASGDLT